MAKEIGRLSAIGFGIECSTGRGTARAAQYFYPVLDRSFGPKANKVINNSSRGRIEDADEAGIAEIWSEGTIEAKVLANGIGYIFKSLFGTIVSSSGGSATAFSHLCTVAQSSQHTSLTVGIDGPVADEQFTNSMVGNFELTAEVGEFIKFTADFLGTQGTTGTVTPAYTDDYEFTGKDVVLKFATSATGLTTTGFAGSTAVPLKTITLTINPNIEREQAVGSTSPTDILNKSFSVEAEFELLYSSDTYKDLHESNDNQAMLLTISDSLAEISTGINPSINFLLGKVQVIERDVSYPNDDFVSETVKVKGLYYSDDAKMITSTIVNSQATYTT